MKAITFSEYGSPDVLHQAEIAKPTPKDNEILVRVRAAAVNYGDLSARRFAHLSSSEFNMPALIYLFARLAFGWNKPKIHTLGSEFAGEVEAVGSSVTKFKTGDTIFAYTGANLGANAEYICLPESGLVALKPANLDYAEAATLPYGALMASSLLNKVNLQPGQKILVNGASGGIGAMAVQLAKQHYRAEVTGVCGTPRMNYVKALGADEVIDYQKQDFTQSGETYDVIFDVLGRVSFARAANSLKPQGILLYASFKSRALLDMLRTALSGSKKVICAFSDEKVESLELVRELAEAGKIKTVIDKRFPLSQTAEAHRYIEAGHRQGNVVISMD